ncbi:hypothetical protein SAMN05443529_102100 [Desulfosporosinus hippei DSM 8344]|uniref:Uncharacterized protein n=1 Tax=Desulfosporosinus hippei DSM 8344 TaxID=1121419 RepID=A0A1G7T5H7_9FIRM|nr:hypothetical protein SAMN05443529_102100 [Desulfosporosinus hippei DSM 8344]
MSVKKFFWEDPYRTTLDAKVTSVTDNVITVDRTIAFAFSGGQASDCGTINGYNIIRAEKVGKEIFYTLDGEYDINLGDEVIHCDRLGKTISHNEASLCSRNYPRACLSELWLSRENRGKYFGH